MLTWVIDRHAEDASHLWRLRRAAVGHGSLHSAAQLAALDRRLEGHLDGLELATMAGLHSAAEQWARRRRPGDTFVLASAALAGDAPALLERVLALAAAEPSHGEAFRDALSWARPERARPAAEQLLAGASAAARALGLVAAAERGWLHAETLVRALGSPDASERAAALRVTARVRRDALAPRVGDLLGDAETHADAALALTLLGDARGREALYHASLASERWELASAFMHACSAAQAHSWLAEARARAHDKRVAAFALGAAGDPGHVEAHLALFGDNGAAPWVGHALYHITAARLPEREAPRAEQALRPTMSPSPPLPDAARARLWWASEGSGRFVPGQRYLLGQPRSDAALIHAMGGASQTLRLDAALGWALAAPGRPWLDLTAPVASSRARWRLPVWELVSPE
jgi:uncharacterized protein (TIGR02270 family)